MISRRHLLAAPAVLAMPSLAAPARATEPVRRLPPWRDVLRDGQGGTVHFNAWGGDDRTSAFIAWTAERMRMLHDITLRHVRPANISESGASDLIWIDSPNVPATGLGKLSRPLLEVLPNAALIDQVGKSPSPDRSVPPDMVLVPWRMEHLMFVFDGSRVAAPPRSMAAMVGWAAANPGRLTHPVARDVVGAAFLTQALIEMAPDSAVLARAATNQSFAGATGPLWTWYAALQPQLWQAGTTFPASGKFQTRLVNDGELDLTMSTNPAEAASGIAHGILPGTARAYVLDGGTTGYCSFFGIPCSAARSAAALLLADFLLSPEAQAHAADPNILGRPTVLAMDRLLPADRARFDLASVPGLLSEADQKAVLPPPHPSWTSRLIAEWEKRMAG